MAIPSRSHAAKNSKNCGVAKIQLVYVRTDLNANEADLFAMLKFFDRKCCVLKRNRAEPDKTEREFVDRRGNVVVEISRKWAPSFGCVQ